MWKKDRLKSSTGKVLSMGAFAAGAFFSLTQSGFAQLRTSHGQREFYNSREATIANDKQDAGVSLASSTRASAAVDTRPRQASTTQVREGSAVSTAAHMRPGTRPVTARSAPVRVQPRRQEVSTASDVVQAGCTSCETGGAMPSVEMGSAAYSDGACDSCGEDICGCGPSELIYGGPMVVDLGCGPLARVLTWLTQRSYYRFTAASFDQTGVDLPILATQGTNAQGGFRPATPVLFGGNSVNDDTRIGYRFQAGIWLDRCQERAIEVRGYDAGSWSTHLQANANTIGANQVLARPVFATNTATQDRVLLVSADRSVVGGFTADVSTQVYGGDILLRRRLGQNFNARWDMFLGYQGSRVIDNLNIYSQSVSAVSSDEIRDNFQAKNEFDGMALGLGRFSRLGNWSLDTRFKLGMGNLRRQVTISGSETINSTFVRQAGLLARATNSDIFIEDTFVVSPEFSIDLGYALTSNLDFSIGYNVLSIPKMARAGAQIDQQADRVPRTDVSGTATGPAFNLRTEDYTLQSLNFGAQWKY